MIFDKYWKMAKEEAMKQKLADKKKERLLSKDMDYQFLEELIEKVNENPLLRVRITLKDGTVLDVSVQQKKKNFEYMEPHEDFLEVH